MDDVLVLCTGNVCRSPVGEALLRHRLEAAGVPARVHSAGVMRDGMAADAHGIAAVAALDPEIDLSSHRSRKMTAQLVRDADLVLGMAREHVREAVVLAPDVFPRAFTLKEIVRRGDRIGPRGPDEDLRSWLARVGAGRTPQQMLGGTPDDDVADPIGKPAEVHADMVGEVDRLTRRLAELAWGVA